jgi:hypothetical protein
VTETFTVDGMPNIDKLILERLVFQEKQNFLTKSKHVFLTFPSLKKSCICFVNFAEISLLTRTAVPKCQSEIVNNI